MTKKLDLYRGYTRDGLPLLAKELTFTHPTILIDKGTHIVIAESGCTNRCLAIFRGDESIMFYETIETDGKD